MNEQLVNIGFGMGLSTAILTLIDILLREQQKRWITTRAELLWIWLDDQKAGKFIKVFLHNKTQKILLILTTLGWLSYEVYEYIALYNTKADVYLKQHWYLIVFEWSFELFFVLGSIYILFRFIHPRFIKIIRFKESILWYLFITGSMMVILWIILFYVFLWTETTDFFGQVKFDDLWKLSTQELVSRLPSKWTVVLTYLIVILMGFGVIETFIFTFLFFTCLVWAIILLMITFIFRLLQFASIRIAENPKGPIIAVSGFLTAMTALLKYFIPG